MAKNIYIEELENYGNKKDLKQCMNPGRSKYIRQVDGPKVYPLGRHSFDKLARDAGAVLRVDGKVLIDTHKLDKFLDENFAEDSMWG